MGKQTKRHGIVYVQPTCEAVLLKAGAVLMDVAEALRQTSNARRSQRGELLGCCAMLAEVSGRCAKLAPEPPEPSRIVSPPSLLVVPSHAR